MEEFGRKQGMGEKRGEEMERERKEERRGRGKKRGKEMEVEKRGK